MYIIDNQVRIVQPPSTFWIYFESSKKGFPAGFFLQ